MSDAIHPTKTYHPLILAAAVILGVVSTAFSAVFLNIALPTMIDELNIDVSQSHWLVSIFIMTSTLSMLLVSNLISHFSLKTTYIGFLLLFIAASIVGGSLNSLWPIIVCRAIQGVSLGVLSVIALITLFDAYPVEKRGHAGAIFGLGVAVSPTLGPTLSGFVVELWGWRATFYSPLLLAFISLAMCWKVLPGKTISTKKPLDIYGFVLLSVILFSLLAGISYLQQQHWPGLPTLLFVASMAISCWLLWQQEKRCPHPLLLLRLFQYPAFTAAAIVSFVYGMGLWGSAFILPLYLQQAIHMSAWDTGMVMLPSGLVLCIMMPVGGHMADKYPARWVVMLGLFAFASSFLLMGWGLAHSSFVLLALLITLSRGLGLGIMTPSLDATATRALPGSDMTDGVAMMNFLRQLGGALSPTLMMLLLAWRTKANNALSETTEADQLLLSSYNESLFGLGLLFLFSMISAWYLQNRSVADVDAVGALTPSPASALTDKAEKP